jgi:hypothetical protein
MRITGPQIVSELCEKLSFGMGRHLYGVLGTYAQLDQFEHVHLAQARVPQGQPFPSPINLNRDLLARIGDEDLRRLVQDEARYPQSVQYVLGQELGNLLTTCLQDDHFVIVKQLELVFAYSLNFSVFRTRATNQDHILLLLPGERRGSQITLFHEADPPFLRAVPANLIADHHLWELQDG